jgi:hypothetical protein
VPVQDSLRLDVQPVAQGRRRCPTERGGLHERVWCSYRGMSTRECTEKMSSARSPPGSFRPRNLIPLVVYIALQFVHSDRPQTSIGLIALRLSIGQY